MYIKTSSGGNRLGSETSNMNRNQHVGGKKGLPTVARKKLVVVGNGNCGKTSLLTVFTKDEFPEEHIPTLFEAHVKDIMIGNQKVELALWDTAGQEAYDRLRPLSYPNTDVIVVCFSVDSPKAFRDVTERWIPEIRHFCPRIPYILICTKMDLRSDPQTLEVKTVITTEEGKQLADKIDALAYMECSAKKREGVTEVFKQAARLALIGKRKRHGRPGVCELL